MDCLATRDRLTDYAVSSLDEGDRRDVDAHLHWCAGCRKEARELREAAALIGLSLGQVEPPAELEHQMVRRVGSAARRGHPSRRRVGLRRSLTILAAVLGLLGTSAAGWLFARQQPLEHRVQTSEAQARLFAQRLNDFLARLPVPASQPKAVTHATLVPMSGSSGGGGAVRVTSSHFEDIALVMVGGLPQQQGPYRVWLARVSGARLYVGAIHRLDPGGGGRTEREYTDDLRLYRYIEVRDHTGRLVLKGAFESTG